MGCTSSAPHMSEVQTNIETTESNKKPNSEECNDDNDSIKVKTDGEMSNVKINEIAVLPSCDSLDNNVQLDRNIKPVDKALQEVQEYEDTLKPREENEYEDSENNVRQQEHNKFSSLKEVADQVFLISIIEDLENKTSVNEDKSCNNEESTVTETKDAIAELPDPDQSQEMIDSKEENGEDEYSEESPSPSQSDSNRSTRWEALADIAAELPPSLAVDPITGQIYALAK